jgi:hypothetical protein
MAREARASGESVPIARRASGVADRETPSTQHRSVHPTGVNPMLLAPLSVPSSLGMSDLPPRRARRAPRPNAVLVAWLLVGCAVVLLVPAVRGGRLFGATLPFWLVAAPLVDLAWIGRERLATRTRCWISALGSRSAPRNVRRQRPARSAACSAARS